MKKAILALVIGMIAFTSCQNSNDDTNPVTTQKTQSANKGSDLSEAELKFINNYNLKEVDDDASRMAVEAIENYINGKDTLSKISTEIVCHGNYADGVSWTYVKVTIGNTVHHRLVRRFRLPEGGALTQSYNAEGPVDCDSMLFD